MGNICSKGREESFKKTIIICFPINEVDELFRITELDSYMECSTTENSPIFLED